MTLRRLAIAAALAASFLPSSVLAKENRCGWIQNPTPGNYWLDDRDGMWIILSQGIPDEPLGMENFPDISTGDYVASNGNYGYTCGCIEAETEGDPKDMARITAIYSVRLLPLAKCLADRSLPKPE